MPGKPAQRRQRTSDRVAMFPVSPAAVGRTAVSKPASVSDAHAASCLEDALKAYTALIYQAHMRPADLGETPSDWGCSLFSPRGPACRAFSVTVYGKLRAYFPFVSFCCHFCQSVTL